MILEIFLAIAAQSFNFQAELQSLLSWVQSLGFVGAIVFVGLYVLATILFIPGALFTLSAGILFGVVWGSVYVFLGATLGATAAFLIGRYLARRWVFEKIAANPKFKAINEAVAQEGFRIVFLTRLSPIFPFVLLNYAFGVTQVSLKDFFFACVGMIPGTISYVYIGSLAGSLTSIGASQMSQTRQVQVVQWALRILGLLATIAVTVYLTRIARQALNETVLSGEVIGADEDDR